MAYLVMTAPAGQASTLFSALRDDLVFGQGWRIAVQAFNFVVLVRGERPPEVAPITDAFRTEGAVIGRIFDRRLGADGGARRAVLEGLGGLDAVEACRLLRDETFGGYVTVLARDRTQPTILRAPSGMIDAFIWRREAVTLVGDEIPEGLAAPIDLAVDWDGVGQILAQPVRAGGITPLHGVEAVDPGVCRHGLQAGQITRVWSPAAVVRARREPGSPEALRAAVDLALMAELDGAERVVAEISGGLDSAIVATSLAALGRPADLAVNFWRDQAEADERVYAQAVADQAGTPLKAVRRELLGLTAEAFRVSSRSVRPNLNGVDPDYDGLLADAMRQTGADLLVSGHGGDVVFYQLGAAEVAFDLLSGQPCDGARIARILDIARRTRRSVWSLAWEALRGRPGANSPLLDEAPDGIVTSHAQGPIHPWVADQRGISRAKRVQIGGLVTSLGVTMPTGREAVGRLAHPLLAQPVVELCLSTPIPRLSSGEGERTLARAAFANRLPALIVQRRSKGDITTFFGRSMDKSAGFLREHLLDGRLVAKGLLDRGKLEAALTSAALIWRDTYGTLLVAATLEAWVRYWEGRTGGLGVADPTGPSVSERNAKARA